MSRAAIVATIITSILALSSPSLAASDEARRIAANIARLPELLSKPG